MKSTRWSRIASAESMSSATRRLCCRDKRVGQGNLGTVRTKAEHYGTQSIAAAEKIRTRSLFRIGYVHCQVWDRLDKLRTLSSDAARIAIPESVMRLNTAPILSDFASPSEACS